MLTTTTPAQPYERRLSSVDVFCMQTYEPPARDPVRHLRAIAILLGFVALALLVALGFAVSRANAMERERDVLAQEVGLTREAQLKTQLAARDREMSAATMALDATVRSDLVDEQAQQQQQRSTELAQLAERIEREKLVKADCVTPRSIRTASNL